MALDIIEQAQLQKEVVEALQQQINYLLNEANRLKSHIEDAVNVFSCQPSETPSNTVRPTNLSTFIGGLEKFSITKDVDIFIDRFQNYCLGASVPQNKQSRLLMNCLDDIDYRIVKADLFVHQQTVLMKFYNIYQSDLDQLMQLVNVVFHSDS